MYPTGILTNTQTGRFHPISFRQAPFPGGIDGARYRSFGHHTEGFASQEEAVAWVQSKPELKLLEKLFEWDGKDVPALTIFLGEAAS